MVNVLPVPVAPSNTCSFLPSFIPSTNSLIASGWSPLGLYLLISSNMFTSPIYFIFIIFSTHNDIILSKYLFVN